MYSALILHDNEVTVMEERISALIEAAGVKVSAFLARLVCKGPGQRRHQETHLQCRGWWASWLLALQQQEVLHFHHGCRAEEKKVGAKKEESKESDDDMGFGLFDQTCFL